MAPPAHVESIIMHEHENRRTEQQHDALPTFCTIQLVNYARIGYSSAVGMFFSFKKQNTFFLGGGIRDIKINTSPREFSTSTIEIMFKLL